MAESIILCIISLFSAIGIVSAVHVCISPLLGKYKKIPRIAIYLNDVESAESIIRLVMHSYPASEILIIDYDTNDETQKIIDKLCNDYPRLKKI